HIDRDELVSNLLLDHRDQHPARIGRERMVVELDRHGGTLRSGASNLLNACTAKRLGNTLAFRACCIFITIRGNRPPDAAAIPPGFDQELESASSGRL